VSDDPLYGAVVSLDVAIEHANRAVSSDPDDLVRWRFAAGREHAIEALQEAVVLLTSTHPGGMWGGFEGEPRQPLVGYALANAYSAKAAVLRARDAGIPSELPQAEVERVLEDASGKIDVGLGQLLGLAENLIREDGWHALVRDAESGQIIALKSNCADRADALRFATESQIGRTGVHAWILRFEGGTLSDGDYEEVLPR